MNKISCDVCLDLMPLVKDNVASEASRKLVEEHIEICEECKGFYNSLETFETSEIMVNDKHIIKKIKKRLYMFAVVTIITASMLGLALSETMGMFYNILIMPSIGILGYYVFKDKSYYVLVSLFLFSYIWLFIKYLGDGMLDHGLITIISIPLYWSIIYASLCGVGLIIGFLLHYAFGKGTIYEK